MNIQRNFSQNLDMLSQEGTLELILAMWTLSFGSKGRSITIKSSEISGIDGKIIETLDVLSGFHWL